MPFSRPSVETIAARMNADLESRLTSNTSLLPVALLRILIIVVAFGIHVIYGVLVLLSKNLLPDTSDEEWTLRHGQVWGVIIKEATFAESDVTFTGVNGTTIPIGTLLQRPNTGYEYETLTEGTISGGVAVVDIKAVEAGENYNWSNGGLILELVSPIPDISDSVTVDGDIEGGQDEETLDEYRARILQRIQKPGSGGDDDDYERWALEVSGVDDVWVFSAYFGAGTVVIVISPADGAVAAATETYIKTKQPVTANQVLIGAGTPFVYPKEEEPMNYTIKINPNTSEVQSSIEEAIDDLFDEEPDPGGTLLISHTNNAIASSGVYDYEITVIEKDGVGQSIADIDFDNFEVPIRDTITFQSF